MNITNDELEQLIATVEKMNTFNDGVSYSLVEIKGTYFIHPQFPADE